MVASEEDEDCRDRRENEEVDVQEYEEGSALVAVMEDVMGTGRWEQMPWMWVALLWDGDGGRTMG